MKTSPILSFAALSAILASAVFVAHTAMAAMPAVGDSAPVFTGKDEAGRQWKLADRLGRKAVLLFFYPRDFTKACTKEACDLRDRAGDLATNDVEVVGVSFDSAESHTQFIATNKLNFRLIADTDGKISDAYGTRFPGKDMSRRVTFLIGKDGKIVHVTDSARAYLHIEELAGAIAKLPKPAAAGPASGKGEGGKKE